PGIGSINANGVFTAPAFLSAATNVVVTARLASNWNIAATATMTLLPSATPAAPAPAPSSNSSSSNSGGTLQLTPPTSTLYLQQSTTLTPSFNGSTLPGTSVVWSIQPGIGSINANGVFTAPAFLSAATNVVVTARLASNWNIAATASVALLPSAPLNTLRLNPPSLTLNAKDTVSLTAQLNQSPIAASSLSWQLQPALGSISASGTYTAPTSVAAATQVVVTARLLSNPSVSASTTITINPLISVSLSPSTGTVLSGASLPLTATVTGSTNQNVTWRLSSPIGSITSSGVYTAPANITSATSVMVIATSVADSSRSASSTLTIQPALSSAITLPVEVYGGNGVISSVNFEVSATQAANARSLYMQIHGFDFVGEVSVQVNNGSWVELNDTNFRLFPLDAVYGGIGGGHSTVRGHLSLATGSIVAGQNRLSFRFNRTDGFTNGFRVLAFNLRDSSQQNLLPATLFEQDDPTRWRAPLSDPAAIQRGRDLWNNAPLTVPFKGSIKARCASCHAQDGRDLKYFNYSNLTIRTRAVFHGLTEQQGNEIASYIRSLPIEAPGRPWNPPYQPGPGLDSRPVTQWAAGAGLSAVLEQDAETLRAIFPNGINSTATAPSGELSAREIPVAFQLPDWNHWLPQIHPIDAYPNFENSDGMEHYLRLRSWLRPGSASAYVGSRDVFLHWGNRVGDFVRTFPLKSGTTEWSELDVRERYSVRQWQLTKMWELQQEFRLEDLSRSWFGPQADARAWNNALAFTVSPHMTGIPRGAAGLRNGLVVTNQFLSFAWYHLQLILNNSNKLQEGTSPIDWPYVYGFIKDMNTYAPQAGLATIWLTKSGQIYNTGAGPQDYAGWSPSVNNISFYLHHDMRSAYRAISAAERNQLIAVQMRHWLNTVKRFPVNQLYGAGFTSPNEQIGAFNLFDGRWSEKTLWTIREMKLLGVDPTLIQDLGAWAATVWPTSANWAAESR
ncbi:hypothetical protein WDZ92_00220, partial [Nostoc sp. NIES-2111]